jgi:hypothetical protein
MKVNRPGSPLSSGAEPLEPLDPQELQRTVKSGRFEAALSQLESQAAGQTGASASPTRAALAQIAGSANLGSQEGMATAVRESARYMIRSRLHEKFRDTEQGTRLVENLSEYVATDPLLNSKLSAILRRLKVG